METGNKMKEIRVSARMMLIFILTAGMLKAVTFDRQLKMGGKAWWDIFGNSVSSAGDVNGDGYDDIIVGAEYVDFGGNHDAGAAYIFFGGPSMDSIPDVILGGDTANDYFGVSVSGAGDVNGDGYDDVIVGAYQADFGGNEDAGAAYIFFGGPSMDSIPDVIMGGDTSYDYFGGSVSSAGDVNGDGYDDIIVGADGNDFGGNTDAGAAYIFYGGPSIDSIYDVKMGGEAAYDYFGESVSSAGDVNGDGYDDVIVGADYADLGSNEDAGAAYIFFGGSSMDSIFDVKIGGETANDYFGWSVSSAGDVNGDGYDDIIVGAYGNDFGGTTEAGAAYLYNFFMFKMLSPKGREVWNVGANEKITWEGKDYADLYISTDGGNTWNEIGDNLQPPEDTNLNTFTFRVPHIPTRYAMVKVVKHWDYPTEIKEAAWSDSFFTIRSTINLLKFEAESEDNNKVKLTWNTDPGPDVLAGYNLYRIKTDGTREKVNTDLIKTLSYEDTKGANITGYELGAVNGLGEEYRIGEVNFYTMKMPLEITPSIVNGKVTIRYFVPDNFSHTSQKVSVNIYSINGQLVKNVYSGMAKHGVHSIILRDLSLPAGSYICVVNIGGKKAYTQGFQVMR